MFRYIGAAVGECAGIMGCESAPDVIRQQLPYLNVAWQKTIYYANDSSERNSIPLLRAFSTALGDEVADVIRAGDQFICFGGDHSCAIGTWSGVASCYDAFGLIWIDAHMDAHTPDTTYTGNYHGMPVSTLLGGGHDTLSTLFSHSAKLAPQQLFLLGIRSYEPEEKALLDRLGVRYYEMPEIKEKGFNACFDDVMDELTRQNLKFGISIDLDGLDTAYIKATGTPVQGGIQLDDLLAALETLDKKQLIGVEITEYNPTLDTDHYNDITVIDKIVKKII